MLPLTASAVGRGEEASDFTTSMYIWNNRYNSILCPQRQFSIIDKLSIILRTDAH